MKRESTGSLLSTVFVDYDNIYLSLKRKNEEAAKRFAKNAGIWINAIASGELISPTNDFALSTPRRIVMNRCYGNPVPRRNSKDNATDMNSFPFVRHHYLRAGFEVIDCPPLTAQLKNSADIRMVMDVRDYLLHDTYFDEFIILSGDADFTPVLHRLRAHARRTVIFANDYTAAPYRAISDGEIREADLISLLLGAETPAAVSSQTATAGNSLPSSQMLVETRTAIIKEVLETVRASQNPVPLEALADRAVRVLGHDKTVGTAWGGMGSFRDLLEGGLPKELKLSNEAPYYVFDKVRQSRSLPPVAKPLATQRISAPVEAPAPENTQVKQVLAPTATVKQPAPAPAPAPATEPSPAPVQHRQPVSEPSPPATAAELQPAAPTRPVNVAQPAPQPVQPHAGGTIANQTEFAPASAPTPDRQSEHAAHAPQPAAGPAPTIDQATEIQRTIARIHEACQAPPLSPPEYKVLFEVMAAEIKTNGLTGARTLVNIVEAAQDVRVNLRRDDARFILEVVSEADPWFEQGASAQLFASRFRNFVVARCRGQGMNLSANELDLIDAWFSSVGQTAPAAPSAREAPAAGYGSQGGHAASAHAATPAAQQPVGQYPSAAPSPAQGQPAPGQPPLTGALGDIVPATASSTGPDPFGGVQDSHGTVEDDFPRIIRTRAAQG